MCESDPFQSFVQNPSLLYFSQSVHKKDKHQPAITRWLKAAAVSLMLNNLSFIFHHPNSSCCFGNLKNQMFTIQPRSVRLSAFLTFLVIQGTHDLWVSSAFPTVFMRQYLYCLCNSVILACDCMICITVYIMFIFSIAGNSIKSRKPHDIQ